MSLSPETLAQFFDDVLPHLDERTRRIVAGAMADACGRGGNTAVARASGMSRHTVIKGHNEILSGAEPSTRLRAPGGGDVALVDKQPGLLEALDELVSPETRGNPMSLLRWSSKSSTHLAGELERHGFQISARTVQRLLAQMGYSLQATRKILEGKGHVDRDAQFRYIDRTATRFVKSRQPVISVDTKKKELVGTYANSGKEYQPSGSPERVNTYDFVDPKVGKAIPYGVLDLSHNEGWVSVGEVADTAEFAVNAIRTWWSKMGRHRFSKARKLLICADGGGSNGHRVKAWKLHLARLASEIDIEITVVHYPPGTSKWNAIEHRMFSFISMNWRGRPLDSYRTVVELISNTTTKAGLHIESERDTEHYETGSKVTDKDLRAVDLKSHAFHGEWNYTIKGLKNRAI
jgi:hypothetical protein